MPTVTEGAGSRTGQGVTLDVAVVEAVSDASGVPVRELPPLYDMIDPDALNALFPDSRTEGQVTFRYAGYVVTVDAERTVEVSPGF